VSGITGYTRHVKIAVSVPDELFERADELAGRLGVSRSQVYARALEEYLESHGAENDPVTAKLNELADRMEPVLTPAAARRLVDTGQWEW
jgi:metal-responsive CopG/Arc/MetJ family transcriptional regulator